MIVKSDWELLDIEPTVDIRQIKKAYANKLKSCSPEDNAEQFQILRQVYERVLQGAKNFDSTNFSTDTFDSEVSANEDETLYNSYVEEPDVVEHRYIDTRSIDNTLIEPIIEELPAYEKLIQQINDLYDNFNSRLDLNKWEEIIKDEILWDVETYRILKTWFLDFLFAGHFVPSEVIQSYNKYFLWEFNSEEFYQKYDDVFMTYIKELINGSIVPGYEYLTQEGCEDIDKYIWYREYGFAYYISSDFNKAYQNLSIALEMMPDDPYLLCMFGTLNDATDNTNGIKYIKLGAEFSSDPWRIFSFGGQLLHRIGKFKKALRYYRKIPKDSYYFIPAQSAITDCLCSMGKYHKCGFLLRSKHRKYREDIEFKDVLYQYYETILELKKNFPNRLIFLYEARITFPYIRKSGEKNPHKYTANYILPSLKLVMKILLKFLIIIAIIVTRGLLAVLLLIIYFLTRQSARMREET